MNPFGNGLVNLLLLGLGLGSLKIGLSGLFSGVASGAKSATFPLASKPLGFFLITAVWLGLGLLMLYAFWRGIAQAKSSGSTDADDEDSDTVPQPRRTAAQQSVSRVPASRSATVQAQPLAKPSFDQFLQRAKGSATVHRTREQLNPPSAAAELFGAAPTRLAPPEPLHVYTSRTSIGFWMIFMTLYAVACGYAAFFVSYALGQKLALLLFAATFAPYLFVLFKLVRAWRWEGPALSLETYGITDHYHGRDQIPWTDVKGVRFDFSDQAPALVLQFGRVDQARAHFGGLNLPFAVAQRIFYKGFEGRIPLSCLRFDRLQLIAVAKAFLRHSRR